MGSARVRPPRLELAGAELSDALQIIQQGLENRPDVSLLLQIEQKVSQPR